MYKKRKEVASLSSDFTPELIQKLFDKIESLTNVISHQADTISNQTNIIAEKMAIIDKLSETITKQQLEIAQLREQLNKNSKNSSKPPSSDGLKKPTQKA